MTNIPGAPQLGCPGWALTEGSNPSPATSKRKAVTAQPLAGHSNEAPVTSPKSSPETDSIPAKSITRSPPKEMITMMNVMFELTWATMIAAEELITALNEAETLIEGINDQEDPQNA